MRVDAAAIAACGGLRPAVPHDSRLCASTRLQSSCAVAHYRRYRVTRDEERLLLAAGAAELRVPADDAAGDRLLRLIDELEAANAMFNLTAIRDRPGMLRKHVFDSLSLHPYLRGARVADVGTGAGFPGLPLAIVDPGRHFCLIEATGKKARFVEQTVARLACLNVEVVNARAETYRPAALFDTVIARALSSLADFVAYAGHLCTPEGRLLAMKGKRPDEEMSAVPKSFRVVAVHRLTLPGLDDERHLVELSPARPTAASFNSGRS